MLDKIIRGGTVVDGTGQKSYKADVGITGNRIEVIGNLADAEAGELLDALSRRPRLRLVGRAGDRAGDDDYHQRNSGNRRQMAADIGLNMVHRSRVYPENQFLRFDEDTRLGIVSLARFKGG